MSEQEKQELIEFVEKKKLTEQELFELILKLYFQRAKQSK